MIGSSNQKAPMQQEVIPEVLVSQKTVQQKELQPELEVKFNIAYIIKENSHSQSTSQCFCFIKRMELTSVQPTTLTSNVQNLFLPFVSIINYEVVYLFSTIFSLVTSVH